MATAICKHPEFWGSKKILEFYQVTSDRLNLERISIGNSRLALSEVEVLRQIDEHDNIVRYLYSELDKKLCYIALKLCKTTGGIC